MLKVVFAVIGLLVISRPGHAASFDCSAARTPDERTVCANPALSELDSFAGLAYGQASMAAGLADVKPVALDFLADRRACGTDEACIMASYMAVLNTYKDRGAKVSAPAWLNAMKISGGGAPISQSLPRRVGQCAQTVVASVVPRLDPGHRPTSEDFDSGTAIVFANRGYQVSYEREETLLQSGPGDGAVICLIAIPRHCPPGDARGRVYATTNLRTGQSWSLPDSEHSCGGA
jgi:uncharacterized protein